MMRFVWTAFMIAGSILAAACSVNKPDAASMLPAQAAGQNVIQRGINLGNALEAPAPGAWGVEIQPAYFDEIKKAGFDSVRIPVRFSAHAAHVAPYGLDETFMQMVDTIIQQALERGLIVILDFHHYEEIMDEPLQHSQRFLAIWRQLAERYQDQTDDLIFELLNEPHDQLDARTWNDLLLTAITTIRSSNPRRKLVIGSVNYNDIQSLEALHLPEDRNLIATFHFYEPFEFTHQNAGWVPGSEKWSGTTWSGTEEEKQAIIAQLDRAARWSEQKQVGLVMGEFGAIAGADAASRQRWTAFVAREAEKRNISWIYWDLCAEFRIFDCHTLQWDDQLLFAIINP